MSNSSLIVLLIVLITLLSPVNSEFRDELPVDHQNNETLVVSVGFVVDDINSINLVSMEYRLDYFVQYNYTVARPQCRKYLDKLAKRNPEEYIGIADGDSFSMVGDDVKMFWVPDTFSPDTKKVELTTIAGRNLMLAIDVEPTGCVFRQHVRLAAIVGCQMDFHNYPFDIQRCPFRLRSHFYPASMVKYKWGENGVRISGANHLKLNNYEVNLDWDEYDSVASDYSLHTFVRITFTFKRQVSHFAVQVTIPTILIVIVAYSSFWISVDSGPGRFLLTVLTLLSLVTMYVGQRSSLPPVSYMTATDVWMVVCMLFIFYAIMELATVNYLDKKRRLQTAVRKAREEEHKKYIERLRTKFESDLTISGSDYVNFMPRGVSLILDEPPCPQRPFGKYKPAGRDHEIDNNEGSDSNNSTGPRHGQYDSNRTVLGNNNILSNNSNSMAQRLRNEFDSDLIKSVELKDYALLVDIGSRIAYPVAFCIFNIIYWPLLFSRRDIF